MHRPIRRTLAAAALVLAGGTVAASPAHALIASSEGRGLELREPGDVQDRVTVSLVERTSVIRYRVEMADSGGQDLSAGPGCVAEAPARAGTTVVSCTRDLPEVKAILGPRDDTFAVAPSFPDPVTVAGGEGNDRLSGGRGASLDGGVGDDVLTMAAEGLRLLRGGPGKDSFAGDGSALLVDARDGVEEAVTCSHGSRTGAGRAVARASRAIVDSLDSPVDPYLVTDGLCGSVDRAPFGETTSVQLRSQTVALKGGQALLKVRCTTLRRCSGRASVSMGEERYRSSRYSIPGRSTRTVKVAASRSARRANVRLAERGDRGARIVLAQLAARR